MSDMAPFLFLKKERGHLLIFIHIQGVPRPSALKRLDLVADFNHGGWVAASGAVWLAILAAFFTVKKRLLQKKPSYSGNIISLLAVSDNYLPFVLCRVR